MMTGVFSIISVVIGVVIGFLLSRLEKRWDRKAAHKALVDGIRSDLQRCTKLNLHVPYDDDLLNSIVLPHIQSLVAGGQLYKIPDKARVPILQVFYLIENFISYRSEDIKLVVKEIEEKVQQSDPQTTSTVRGELRNKAISDLEKSLSGTALLAVNALDEKS